MPNTLFFLKWVTSGGTPWYAAQNGSTFVWSLPHRGQPGAWTPALAAIEPCRYGYHAATALSLRFHKPYAWDVHPARPHLYLFEGNEELPYLDHNIRSDSEKIVFAQARLVRRIRQPRESAMKRLRDVVYWLLRSPIDDGERAELWEILTRMDLTPAELRRLVLYMDWDQDGRPVFVTGSQVFTDLAVEV